MCWYEGPVESRGNLSCCNVGSALLRTLIRDEVGWQVSYAFVDQAMLPYLASTPVVLPFFKAAGPASRI